jgi:hypothetical protein
MNDLLAPFIQNLLSIFVQRGSLSAPFQDRIKNHFAEAYLYLMNYRYETQLAVFSVSLQEFLALEAPFVFDTNSAKHLLIGKELTEDNLVASVLRRNCLCISTSCKTNCLWSTRTK